MLEHIYWTDIVGYIGALTIVLFFFLNIKGSVNSEGLLYPFMNLMAGIFMLISLYRNVNMPSIVIEIFWCSIGLYGIAKYFIRRKRR